MMEISDLKGFRFMAGRFRIVQEPEGFFVVGEGLVLPVESYEEALELINEIEAKTASAFQKTP
jgi:spermidine/putrescine-binding protein